MLVLTETTDKIDVVLAGAITTNPLRCYAAWRDMTTTAYTPGRSAVNTNNTTDVTFVASPAASTQRVIDTLSVYNDDTAAATVTLKLDANGTECILCKVSLGIGERLEYTDGGGFRVLTATGAAKSADVIGTPTVNQLNQVVLGSDVTNNNAVANTIADVTGLSFPVVAGEKYWFRFIIPYTAAATTTGSRFAINGPASPTLLNYRSTYPLTATSETVNYATAYDIPAASNASSLTAGNVAIIEGIIVPSGNGTVIARFASEVLSSAIVAKAGALLQWVRVA